MDDETSYTVSVQMQAVFFALALAGIIAAALMSHNDRAFGYAIGSCFGIAAANVVGQWAIIVRNDLIRWIGLGLWVAACIAAAIALLSL